MGNNRSFPGLPSSELKLKCGDRYDHIPYPNAGSKSFGNIFADVEFKDYILRNLQSHVLMSSILQNSSDESVVIDGIRYFQYNSAESRKSVIADITKFHQFTAAGIKGQLGDTLKLTEKEVDLHQDTTCSPFLRSFQCRLAAIRAMEKSIAMERKVTKERFLPRDICTSVLNSREHPYLSIVCPMLLSGLAVIRILPLCLPSVDTGSTDALILPFAQIVQSIDACSDLYLFSSWSPPPQRPLQKLSIETAAVYSNASPADAAKAVSTSSHACWSCASSGGTWAARLPCSVSVRSLAVSWAPLSSQGTGSVCGAPKTMVILVRSATPGSLFRPLTTIDIDEERKCFKNWQHCYRLNDATDVVEVMLQVTGLSAGNQGTENSIKMFGVDIYADDTESTWIDMLQIMQDMQNALMGLRGLALVEKDMYSGLLSSARTMGSLSILLGLLSQMHAHDLDESFRDPANAQSFIRLIAAIREEDLRVRRNLESASSSGGLDRTIADIGFDETAKSPEMVISEEGTAIGGSTSGNSYGLLTCEMESGIWEWEITIVKDTRGDETSCLGVARRPVVDCNYDSTGDMWLVRCYNGDVYHNGRQAKRKAIPHIHPNDNCRFTFDADSQTLSLAVNDLDVGVIFENVDKGVSPAVAFYGSGKKVKLLSIKQLGTGAKAAVNIDVQSLDPLDPFEDVLQLTPGPAGQICRTLLRVLSSLASARTMALENGLTLSSMSPMIKTSMQSLEYPYCIEVSEGVFRSIFDLLREFMNEGSSTAGTDDTIMYLLKILNAQFACLTAAEVHPAVVGMGSCDGRSPLVDEGHMLLRELMDCTRQSNVKRAAAEAFSHGIPLFLSTVEEKIAAAINLIDNVFVSSNPRDDAKGIVLKTVMKKISKCSEVVHVLEYCKQGKSARAAVSMLIKKCLFLSADVFNRPHLRHAFSDIDAVIVKHSAEFISKFQEQLIVDLSSDTEGTTDSAWCCEILVEYCQDLCYYTGDILQKSYVCDSGSSTQYGRQVVGNVLMVAAEHRLSQSIVCLHFVPLVHALCYCLQHLSTVRAVAPFFVRIYLQLCIVVSKSHSCKIAQTLVSNSLKRVYQKPSFVEDADTGWRRLTTARFEDSDSTFAVSDDGVVYTSIQSSNTCAVVTSGFSGSCRAAWEFRLEADSTDDECAVFGAAHLPITSRSYSASGDLYMRRAYNGYLYNRGRTAGVTMAKIHTGDIVRIEFDGRMGTISYGINGGEQEVAFTDVTGEIYPCCGSYRNNVRIRLVKVEVYGSNASKAEIDNDVRSPDVVHWVSDSALLCSKDPSVLAMVGDVVKKKPDSGEGKTPTWLTCRGDRGAQEGTHAWNIDVMEQSDAIIAVGVVMGGNPYNADMLASPCTARENEPVVTSVLPRSPRGNVFVPHLDFSASVVRSPSPSRVRNDSFEAVSYDPECDYANVESDRSEHDADDLIMQVGSVDEVTFPPYPSTTGIAQCFHTSDGPIGHQSPLRTSTERISSPELPVGRPVLSRTSTPAGAPGMHPMIRTNSPVNALSADIDDNDVDDLEMLAKVYVTIPESPVYQSKLSKQYSYSDNDIVAMSWCSNGSLWLNGEKKCNMFGESHLPLSKMSTVRVQVNLEARTVEYFVNGEYVGVAFGPTGSGAAVTYTFPRRQIGSDSSHRTYYPAASISVPSQLLRIRASGLNGSTVLPIALFTQKTLASALGRFAACLLAGPRIDKNEVDMSGWMRSPLFSGGLEQAMCSNNAMGSEWDDNMASGWQERWSTASKYVPKADCPWDTTSVVDIKRDISRVMSHVRKGPAKYSDSDFLNALASAPPLSGGGDDEDDGLNQDIKNLLLWLDDINPDPPFLRSGLMKSGIYSFPRCEYPVIACMLKHCSLVPEARRICHFFHVDGYENMKGNPGTAPSPTMTAMWMKIKQLRSTLRRQRQYFLSNPIGDSDESKRDSSSAPPEGSDTSNKRNTDLLKDVVWTSMPYNLLIRRNIEIGEEAGACDFRVLSLGIDYRLQIVYTKISASVSLASQASPEGNPDLSLWVRAAMSLPAQLLVNGLPVKSSQVLKDEGSDATYEFRLREASGNAPIVLSPDTIPSFDVALEIGTGESGSCLLLSPQSDVVKRCDIEAVPPVLPIPENTGARAPSFDAFCDTITQKALFLLSILPSSESCTASADVADVGERANSQSPRVEALLAAQSSAKWLSDDATDGWKNVTDVLRMQKRMRRDISRESLASIDTTEEKFVDPKDQIHIESTIFEDIIPVLDLEGSEEENDPPDTENISHKIMQECALFITSTDDSNDISLSSLMEVMKRRYQRARYRSYGTNLLNTLLTTPEVAQDPFSVEELLVFVRSSLCMGSSLSSAAGDVPVEYAAPDAHYLSNLEGSSFESLQIVQLSFLDLYSTISSLLQKFIDAWISSTYAIADINSDSPNDVQYNVKVPRSVIGAIFAMLSCWSLHFSGRDHRFLMSCSLLPTLHKLVALETFQIAISNWMTVASRKIELISSAAKISEGEDTLLKEWKLWDSEYVQSGLQSGRISCRALLFHICQAPPELFELEERRYMNFPQQAKPFEETCSNYSISQLSLMYEKMLAICRQREDNRLKQVEKARIAYQAAKEKQEQELSQRLRALGVPLFDCTNMCKDVILEEADQVAGIRDLATNCKVASVYADVTYNFAADERQRTGNYFEVTILEAGQRDIGIGLAVVGIFPVSGEMPGWELHSYGYHGDDGRRFGQRNTATTWPTWNNGDVIGCGLDITSRSIFYTHNGRMLGDGFTAVEDDLLRPVVSFHSPNLLLKVRINFGTTPFMYNGDEVYAHPAAVAFSEREMTSQSTVQSMQITSDLDITVRITAEQALRMEDADVVRLLEVYGESTTGELSDLQVRLLAANASHMERSDRSAYPEEKEESEMFETKEELVSSGALRESITQEIAELNVALDAATSHINELTNLRNYAWALIRYILTTSCGNGEDIGLSKLMRRNAPREDSDDLDAMPSSSLPLLSEKSTFGTPTSLTFLDSITLQESIVAVSMKEVKLGAQYLEIAASGRDTDVCILASHPVKGSSVTSPIISQAQNGTLAAQVPSQTVPLEMCEIEGIMEKHLFAINTLLIYSSSILDQISTPENLGSLLQIRQIGSPRLQRLAINILFHCLPNISPEVADQSYLSRKEHEHLSHKTSAMNGRMLPDKIVRSLLSRVRAAVAVPSENIWRNFLESQWVSNDLALSGTHNIPLGYGRLVLWEAGHNVSLIQRLFESPYWTEVISCYLADSIRSATAIMRKLNTQGDDDAFDLTADECETIQLATAACVVFSEVGSLCPGALIMDDSGQVGRVVYNKQGDEDICVVFVDPEAGEAGLSYESVVSVPIRSIHSIPKGVDIDYSILTQPIIEELLRLMRVCLSWFKRNCTRKIPPHRSFLMSQIHRLCALLTTSLSVILEKHSDFVMDCCRDVSFELKDIVETAVIPIALLQLPSLHDLCRMRLFCQARILESGVGCIANTRISTDDDKVDLNRTVESELVPPKDDSPGGTSCSAGTDSTPLSPDTRADGSLKCVFFDESTRASRMVVATELAAELSMSFQVCLSRLEYFAGDRQLTVESLLESGGEFDMDPVPISIATFSDDNAVRHCDFDVSDTGRPSSDTVACGFRTPYACTVSRLGSGSKSAGVSPEQAPPELSTGNIICRIDDEGALVDSNCHLEVCMSSGQSESIIAMFCDYDLGVDLYHGFRRSDGCVVSHLYETKMEDFPELLLSLDISLTIVRLRQLASKMIADRSINLQRDAGGKEQWLSLLKYIMRGEIMTAGETKDFGKLLSGICDSVMTPSPVAPGGDHIDALRSLMIEDVFWNLHMLMESSTLSSSGSGKSGKTTPSLSSAGYYCASPHPLAVGHSVAYDMDIPTEWRGVRVCVDRRCSTAGPESTLSLYFSKEEKARFQFFGGRDNPPSDIQNIFASHYVPGVSHLRLQFSHERPKPRISMESVGDSSLYMEVSNAVVLPGYCYFFEVSCLRESAAEMSFGIYENSQLGGGERQNRITITSSSCVLLNGDIMTSMDWEPWSSGDVVGCLLEVQPNFARMWFGRNGDWNERCTLVDSPSNDGFKLFFARNSASDTFRTNFGDSDMLYPPPKDTFPEWKCLNDVAVISSAENSCRTKNWGYQLYVQPLESLAYVVARDFDLIAKTTEEEVLHNGRSTMVTLYFWRPKRISGYKSCGDIVTRENRPPRGAIAVHVDHCTAIKKYTKAFYAPKHEFTIWRPLPPEGYATLGDVVTAGSAKPSAAACSCIPLWALKACGIGGWIFKTKSKGSGSSKGVSLCSIWDVNSHMGYFVGSASERRDFSRKSSDGTMSVVVGYTFKTELVHVIAGEWAIDIDSPSLMWTVHLIDFMLDHPRCRDQVLTKDMFAALLRFMSARYSPDEIAVVPLLIKMVRYSFQYGVPVGIENMRSVCKLILTTAYSKCKGDIKGGRLPGAVLTLVDLVCEATSHPDSGIVKNVVKVVPFDADLCVQLLARFHATLSTAADNSLPWTDRVVTPFYLQYARLVHPPSEDHALSGKTHALQQLGSIRRFLQYLSSTGIESPASARENINLLPPELIVSSWYKHLKACVLKESAHPYCDTAPQRYTTKLTFPSSRYIFVTVDRRSCLGPNASLKIFSKGGFLMVLRGSDLGEKRAKSIVVTGCEVELDFEVLTLEGSEGMDASPPQAHWGWSVVVSADGPVYETVSTVVDLSACAMLRQQGLDSYSPSRVTTPIVSAEVPDGLDRGRIGIAACKVEKIQDGSHLSESDIVAVQQYGTVVAAGALKVPLAHELKVALSWKSDSSNAAASKVGEANTYVVELISRERDPVVRLFHVWEDCALSCSSLGSAVDFKLYCVDNKSCSTAGPDSGIGGDKSLEDNLGETGYTNESKESPPVAQTPVDWNCPVCTFLNLPTSMACEMCGTANPASPAVAGEEDVEGAIFETGGADAATPQFAVWICSRCTLHNRLDLLNCEICQAPRDVEVPAADTAVDVPSSAAANITGVTNPFLRVVDSPDSDSPPPLVEGEDELLTQPSPSLRQDPSVVTDDVEMPSSRANTSMSIMSDSSASVSDTLVIAAEGIFTTSEHFETLLTQAVLDGRWTPVHLKAAMSKWTRQADDCLLEYFNSNPGVEKLALHPLQWSLPYKYMTYSSFSLSDYNLLEIQSRSLLLCLLNSSIKHILPIIDIANPDPSSLGALIRSLNKYIMIYVKQPMLQRSIDATMSSGAGLPAHVRLDNFKFVLGLERGEVDPSDSQNCFVQAFHQLNKLDSKVFRFIFNADRVFQIHFEGESGIDAGGVFREGVTRIVEDLFDTKHFNLLVLCPNGQNEVHMNIDKCLPNPSHASPLALQMMEFVGKIIAMSIRAKLALPFSFPSLVWKKILREEVTMEDLRAVDVITCSLLEAVRHCESDGITNQDLFSEKYGDKLRFTYTGCDGVERELFEGGRDVVVDFDTREAYCDQVLEKRLCECDRHIEAIIMGMEGVIQMQVIHLFSWSQLEVLVGGNPVFDIDVWKANTESSIPPRNLEMFWNVIESLTPKEQEGFVRFAWGRSRLPPAKEFTVKMKLVSRGGEKLPVAHTCFFSIELPNYRTEEEMRHGLLTAIHFGATGILMG